MLDTSKQALEGPGLGSLTKSGDLLHRVLKQLVPKKIREEVHRGGRIFPRYRTVMVQPQQGELFEKPAGQIDKKKLNSMYAAWKMRKSGKILSPGEKQFIAQSLGEHDKLSDGQLREYFKGQYGALQQQEPRKENYLDAKSAGFKDITGFKQLIFDEEGEKKDHYARLLSAARGLRNLQPTNPHTKAWIDSVIKGAEKYQDSGDIGMMEYASNRARILFSNKNWPDEAEEWEFTLHGGKKI